MMEEKTELWLVGQAVEAVMNLRNHEFASTMKWEFQGIFDSEEKAIEACRTRYYFVAGPFYLNENLPHETEQPNKNYYPLA